MGLHNVGAYVANLKNRTKTEHSEKQVTCSTDYLFLSANGLSVACLYVVLSSCFHKNLVLCKLDLLKENLSNILFFPS